MQIEIQSNNYLQIGSFTLVRKYEGRDEWIMREGSRMIHNCTNLHDAIFYANKNSN